MNYTLVISSAIIGAIFGGLGAFVAGKYVSETELKFKTKRNVITYSFVLFSLILNSIVVSPYIEKLLNRDKIEKTILQTKGLDFFQDIKEYDLPSYNIYLDQLVENSLKYRNQNDANINAMIIGQNAMKKYYAKASSTSINSYLKCYVDALEDLNSEDPIIVCELENPRLYGSPGSNVLDTLSEYGIGEKISEIIKQSMINPEITDMVFEKNSFNTFIMNFQNEFPESWKFIVNQNKCVNISDIENTSSSYIIFYKEMLKLEPKLSAAIYKYLRK